MFHHSLNYRGERGRELEPWQSRPQAPRQMVTEKEHFQERQTGTGCLDDSMLQEVACFICAPTLPSSDFVLQFGKLLEVVGWLNPLTGQLDLSTYHLSYWGRSGLLWPGGRPSAAGIGRLLWGVGASPGHLCVPGKWTEQELEFLILLLQRIPWGSLPGKTLDTAWDRP